MQYAPTPPVFGNARDELREVAPGLWGLGPAATSATTGRPRRDWFVLREE